MKIVVLGAEGQVGRELTARGAGAGPTVVGFGRATGDVTDAPGIHRLFAAEKPDVVINVAAMTAVDRAEDAPDHAYMVNAGGAANVARAAADHGAALIHVSTDFVFDGGARTPYREGDATNPISVYGASKEAGERDVRLLLRRHLIVRTAWVFGFHGKNFVKTVLERLRQGRPLRVVDDQVGNPTPARNLARALLDLAARIGDETPFGTYHLAGAGRATWHELASAVAARVPGAQPIEPIPTAEYPTRARRPAYSVLDCAKIERDFGIALPPWRDGLEDVLDEFMKEGAA